MSEPATVTPYELKISPLDQKQVAALQEAAPKILKQAQELEIATLEDYEASGAFLDVVAERKKKVDEFFEQTVAEANRVHKFLTGLRAMLTLPYSKAEELIKQRRRDWRMEEERKRQAIEDEERKKAKAQQEAQAIEEASQLQQMGETEAAQVVIDRAAAAPPPPVIVPSTVPKQKGHAIKTVWKWRVKNPALIKREFLVLDESKVNPIVTRLGPDAAAIVGGIEVYPEEIESVRRR
jgi:hypothetical protein